MQCFHCDAALQAVPFDEGEVAVCAGCGGAWFAKGSLSPYIRRVLDNEAVDDAPFRIAANVTAEEEVAEHPQDCPDCAVRMEKINYAYDSNIILDRCRRCGGTWADPGEVEQLAKHVKGNPKLREMVQHLADTGGID